jgi:hypothetical protein
VDIQTIKARGVGGVSLRARIIVAANDRDGQGKRRRELPEEKQEGRMSKQLPKLTLAYAIDDGADVLSMRRYMPSQ